MRTYVKYDTVICLLKQGWEIYTDRGFGGTPYTPLFFHLEKGKNQKKNVHHATIKKLIKNKIINGTDVTHAKYKLI